MGWLGTLLLVVQLIAAISVIVLVLIQHGKGADMGAAFGSGSSGSLFGATGSANFLSRTTAVFAAVFFVSTLGLALIASRGPASGATGSVITNTPSSVPAAPSSPAAPVAPTPNAPATNEIPK
ncbi:MAG TPA: preprotein translocase subunit SecG [Burkholderiaceae bacterium]|nr:preprotein translocase subunit SecG [Burkholderiaceae bacterium]